MDESWILRRHTSEDFPTYWTDEDTLTVTTYSGKKKIESDYSIAGTLAALHAVVAGIKHEHLQEWDRWMCVKDTIEGLNDFRTHAIWNHGEFFGRCVPDHCFVIPDERGYRAADRLEYGDEGGYMQIGRFFNKWGVIATQSVETYKKTVVKHCKSSKKTKKVIEVTVKDSHDDQQIMVFPCAGAA